MAPPVGKGPGLGGLPPSVLGRGRGAAHPLARPRTALGGAVTDRPVAGAGPGSGFARGERSPLTTGGEGPFGGAGRSHQFVLPGDHPFSTHRFAIRCATDDADTTDALGSGGGSNAPRRAHAPALRASKAVKPGGIGTALNNLAAQDAGRTHAVTVPLKAGALSTPQQWAQLFEQLNRAVWHGPVTVIDAESHVVVRREARSGRHSAPFVFELTGQRIYANQWERLDAVLAEPDVVRAVGAAPLVLRCGFVADVVDDDVRAAMRAAVGTLVSHGYERVQAVDAAGKLIARGTARPLYEQPTEPVTAPVVTHVWPSVAEQGLFRVEGEDAPAHVRVNDSRVLDTADRIARECAEVAHLLAAVEPTAPLQLTDAPSSQHLYPHRGFLGIRRMAPVTIDARNWNAGFGVHQMVLHFDPAHDGALVRADVTVAVEELAEQADHLRQYHVDRASPGYHDVFVGGSPVPVVIKIVAQGGRNADAIRRLAREYCTLARQAKMPDVTIVCDGVVIGSTIPGRVWRPGMPPSLQAPAEATASATATDTDAVAAARGAEATGDGAQDHAGTEAGPDGGAAKPPPPPVEPPHESGPSAEPEPPRRDPAIGENTAARAVPVTTAIPHPPTRDALRAAGRVPEAVAMPRAVQAGDLAAKGLWLLDQPQRPHGILTAQIASMADNLWLLANGDAAGMPVMLFDVATSGYFRIDPTLTTAPAALDCDVQPDRVGHVVRELCALAAKLQIDTNQDFRPLVLTLAHVQDLPSAALQQRMVRAVEALNRAGFTQVVVRTASGIVLAASDAAVPEVLTVTDATAAIDGDAVDAADLAMLIDTYLNGAETGTARIAFRGATVPEGLRAKFSEYEAQCDAATPPKALIIQTATEQYEFGRDARLQRWTAAVVGVAVAQARGDLTVNDAALVAEVFLARYCVPPEAPAAMTADQRFNNRRSPLTAEAMQRLRAGVYQFGTPYVELAGPSIARLIDTLFPTAAAVEPDVPAPAPILDTPPIAAAVAPTDDVPVAAPDVPAPAPVTTEAAAPAPEAPTAGPQPLALVQSLWTRIGATTRPELTTLLQRLWVMEQALPGVPSWEIPADGVLTRDQAAQAVRLAVAAATAHACNLLEATDLHWLRKDVMPAAEMFGDPATLGMDTWPTACITPPDFRDLVDTAAAAVQAVLDVPPPPAVEPAPPAPTPAGDAPGPRDAAAHGHGFQRRTLVQYRLGILRAIQPPVVDAAVLAALEQLPTDLAFSLLSHNDPVILAAFLRDQLPLPDRDGVPRLVKLVWAALGCYQSGYASTLAKWWRTYTSEAIRNNAKLQSRLTQLRAYGATDTIQFADLDPALLHAAAMVGFTVAVTAALHRAGDTNLLYIQTALESIQGVETARTWDAIAALSLDTVLAQVRTLEPPEESDRAAYITLSGDWPNPFLATDRTHTAPERLAANVPRIKALVEAMVAAHPFYNGDIRALDITKPDGESVAPIERRFQFSDGRQRIGNRFLTLKLLAEMYWELVTAPGCPGAHLPELLEPTLAVKLDCLVEHLFDRVRYGRTRFTRMSRAAFAARAKEWNVDQLLPVLRGDRNAVAKLLGTRLFAEHWSILSPLERNRFVEGFSQLPLAQGTGTAAPRGPRKRISLGELAEQERVLIDFLRARNLRLQGLGGEDIFHLYEIYRFVTHVRFGRDYDTAMNELAYRLGERADPNPDLTARITAETDPVLLAVLRQAHDYYQRKRAFGELPVRLRRDTLNPAQVIGAQWLTEPNPALAQDPQFPIDPRVKFLLDGARLGKTRQMFAAWLKLVERGEVPADGAVVYVTRSTNMDEVAAELQRICNDGQAPSVGLLRWEDGQRGVAVADVAGKQVRIVHYQNLWRINPYETEREIARVRARIAKKRLEMADADPREARAVRILDEIQALEGTADKMEAQLPQVRAQWAGVCAQASVVIADECQEAENPSEDVKQANAVRDAIAHVRFACAEAGRVPPCIWWATASLYNSDPGHIQALLETSFPTHALYRQGAAFRAAHTHTMDGLLKLHNDLMGQFSLRRTVEEVYEVGEEIPALREIPYAELGRYEHSREQLRLYRAIYLHFMEWARRRNETLPPERQIDLDRVNPLQIFQLMEWTTQHPVLVGGSDDSPMVAEAVRIACENAAAGRKTVIVCQYTKVIDAFLRAFRDAGVTAERFDGQVEGLTDTRFRFEGRRLVPDANGVRVRNVTVNLDHFNNAGDVPVLVANVKSIRAGLRVDADDIILATEPISATERHQLVRRIQSLNAAGETQREAVRVITMVGVHPPRFLDSLQDPTLIALFEAGSLGQLVRAYVQDNQIVWELILNGEVSPEGMARVLEKGFIARGVLGPIRERMRVDWMRPGQSGAATANARRARAARTTHFMPALAPLLDMCENGALTPRDKERCRRQIARLAHGFQAAGVTPDRLVTVIQKLARRGERGFSWADLDVIIDLLECDAPAARDLVLTQLPRALEEIAEAGLRFTELAEALQLEESALAALALPAILAGRLWRNAAAVPFFQQLLAALRAEPDAAARAAYAARLVVALARLSSCPEDLYDDTMARFFARPRRDPLLALGEQVAALEQLALQHVLDPSGLQDCIAENPARAENLDDVLEDQAGQDTWTPLLRALQIDGTPGPTLVAGLEALGRRPGQLEAVGATLQRLTRAVEHARESAAAEAIKRAAGRLGAYHGLLRATLTGSLATWLAEAPDFLTDAKSRREFWEPWGRERTTPMPDRVVDAAAMEALLQREYERLMHKKRGLSPALFAQLEEPWVAEAWTQYRDAEDRDARAAQHAEALAALERFRSLRSQVQAYFQPRSRRRGAAPEPSPIELTPDDVARLTAHGISAPDVSDADAVRAYDQHLATWTARLDRLVVWMELSRAVHRIFHHEPDADAGAALAAVQQKIWELEDARADGTESLLIDRVLDHLHQLRRQLTALLPCAASSDAVQRFTDVTVTDTGDPAELHRFLHGSVDLAPRFRHGADAHLDTLLDIAGSRNRRFVVARSHGRPIAVAVAVVEKNAQSRPHIHLEWAWFTDGYDFRTEMLAHLQGKICDRDGVAATGGTPQPMEYKREGPGKKTLLLTTPLPFSPREVQSIPAQDRVALQSTGSHVGDRTVEAFSRLDPEGSAKHDAMIIRKIVSVPGS